MLSTYTDISQNEKSGLTITIDMHVETATFSGKYLNGKHGLSQFSAALELF